MGRVNVPVLMFAIASVSVAAACSSAAEQPLLNQYFTASRLRDTTSLANFSTVAFEPQQQGIVTSFEITGVAPEQHKELRVKALAQAQTDAKTADDEYTKRKDAYEIENIEAIRRVLKAERDKAPVNGKDAEVQAAWSRFLDEGTQVSRRMIEARKALDLETRVVRLSVDDPRDPVDLTTYDGELVSKDVTIDATIRLPGDQTAKKTLVVTMQRALLNGNRDRAGRWIITGIKDSSSSPSTKTS
jgi:hypothetical protein